MRYNAAIELNILALLGVLSLLVGAYVIEITHHELPCPLCLLQRLGLLMIAFGFLLNLNYGVKMEHYGFSLLGSIFTTAVAMRQIVLHIVPTCSTYGPKFCNLHLYTWSFIAASLVTIFIALELAFDPFLERIETTKTQWIKKTIVIVSAITIALTICNAITTFLTCGVGACPENPTQYKYLFN